MTKCAIPPSWRLEPEIGKLTLHWALGLRQETFPSFFQTEKEAQKYQNRLTNVRLSRHHLKVAISR